MDVSRNIYVIAVINIDKIFNWI